MSQIVDELLSNIKERQRKILIKRFGLNGRNPLVLEKIGREFGVTRERIRQIEVDSFRRLAFVEKSDDFKRIIERAKKEIIKAGDFYEKDKLKEVLCPQASNLEKNQLMFILNSAPELSLRKGTLKVGGFWFLKEKNVQKSVLAAHQLIVKFIKENKRPVRIGKIVDFLQTTEQKDFFPAEKARSRAKMICLISRQIDSNIMNEWGLNNWRIISQRGSGEKAYLVLRQQKKPLHFRKIAQLISLNWSDGAALPQTVHNELIKDKKRFVLVGRGTYGLSSWGLVSGTVKEIILNYMTEVNKPLGKESIVEYVLSRRQVKAATVIVTLSDRRFFAKTKDGLFQPRK
ncbi:MAG TPA: hypothetical protein GX706_00140 [Candidatus Moranbacteria bacterium]|nr:hypothetical protein [Candidatus Moranbacteria bacterium]